MSKKTIAKIPFFVIFSLLIAACGSGGKAEKPGKVRAENPNFDTPRIVGKISSKDIPESSGIAASRCAAGVLWTHNDSGNGPFIFAIDPAGQVLATYKLNVKNKDWEDIATFKDTAGQCFIYLGEIGDNEESAANHEVYRIPEPVVPAPQAPGQGGGVKAPIEMTVQDMVKFSYPDKPQNAETLMVHPVTGNMYVATKHESGPSFVYRITPSFGSPDVQKAERVGQISVPAVPNGYLTGGDISPDGRHAILCDYTQGYELSLPDGSSNFEDIWAQDPVPVDLGKRPHGESVGYSVDGTAVYATSENENAPVIEVKRRSK
jgi:hypothetical protein